MNEHPKLTISELVEELDETRCLTLELIAQATESELSQSFHPDFSPLGWHLGHIAAFEAMWIGERAHGLPPLSREYEALFDPTQRAKPERTGLPALSELLTFAASSRRQTLECLDRPARASSLLDGLFVYRLVLSHEQQHTETLATILRMRPRIEEVSTGRSPAQPSMLHISAGDALIGEDNRLVGYDNERPAHHVHLGSYEIDSQPITAGEWQVFIAEGGYRRRELWSADGWAWLQAAGVTRPCHSAPSADSPVEGICAYEADAYARFVGKRLPTELEWEHAARLHGTEDPRIGVRCGSTRAVGASTDFIGNVWEWTSSTFAPYPGFESFPYAGYSTPYFDGAHRVLRGGSWATQRRIARPSFRNWYPPHWRAIFAGLRCARS